MIIMDNEQIVQKVQVNQMFNRFKKISDVYLFLCIAILSCQKESILTVYVNTYK